MFFYVGLLGLILGYVLQSVVGEAIYKALNETFQPRPYNLLVSLPYEILSLLDAASFVLMVAGAVFMAIGFGRLRNK